MRSIHGSYSDIFAPAVQALESLGGQERPLPTLAGLPT